MRVPEVIGKNIQKVMNENSNTLLEIAKLIGVTRQTFSNYLNGESTIDSEKLAIIAGYFSKDIRFFFEEKHEKIPFMFRAQNPAQNFDEEDRKVIIKYMNYYCELAEKYDQYISYLPEQYKLTVKCNDKTVSIEDPKLGLKKLTNELENKIELIANDQRKKLGINESVGNEILRALENTGIRILFKPLNNLDLFGISAYSFEKGFFILINDNDKISEERKLFSLVHEYAHIIFHRDSYLSNNNYLEYGNKKNILEATADAFAGYFLAPRNLIKKYENIFTGKTISMRDLIIMKQELNISLMSLTMNLRKYKYINDSVKRGIFNILIKNGYEKREPYPSVVLNKNQRYNQLIKIEYLKGQIDNKKAAKLMSKDVREMNKLIKQWTEEKNIPMSQDIRL